MYRRIRQWSAIIGSVPPKPYVRRPYPMMSSVHQHKSADNSMLVYPAWRNVHGVTPIVPTREGGYRNSLVFYSLKAFNKYWDAP